MIIPPSLPSIPASAGSETSATTANSAENGGFAAIFSGTAIATDIPEARAAAPAVPIAPEAVVDLHALASGKATGKALPDLAAATLAKMTGTASGTATGTTSETLPDSADDLDGAQTDPAETILAVLTALPPAAPMPAATTAASPASTPSAPSTTAAPTGAKTVPVALDQLPLATPNLTPAKADADKDAGRASNPPIPMETGAPASFERVRLAAIEVAPVDNGVGRTPNAPTATAAPLPLAASVATILDSKAKEPAEAPGGTATMPAATPPAAPQVRTAAPLAKQAAPAGEHGPATNETAPMQQPVPLLAALPPIASAAPQDSAQVPAQSPSQAAAQGPQDFATLVGKIAEAREAAGAHVVRTAINHAQFGSVSLQFRPDSSGISVTMASADPAFGTAVHAGVAATLVGQMGGDQGDASRGDTRSDGRQVWQQSAGSTPAQTGSGFSQDQRQTSPQSGSLASGQDGERRHAFAARDDTSAPAPDGGASRPARPDRGGIYA